MQVANVKLKMTTVPSPASNTFTGVRALESWDEVQVDVEATLTVSVVNIITVNLYGIDAGSPPVLLRRLVGPQILSGQGSGVWRAQRVISREILDEDPGYDRIEDFPTFPTETGHWGADDGPQENRLRDLTAKITFFAPRHDEIRAQVVLSGLGRFSPTASAWSPQVRAPLHEPVPAPRFG